QSFKELNVTYADSTFFEIFPLQLLEGTTQKALVRPNTIAISRTAAEKYFGSHQLALGQNLIRDDNVTYQITAVFEDIPVNTHFQTDFLIAMNGYEGVENAPPFWAANNNFFTYLKLRPGTDQEAFYQKFQSYSREKLEYTANQLMGMTLEEFEATGQYARVKLQALKDIHLHSQLEYEMAPNGNIQYVWIFSAIAFFVLIIACINYMNLATASSATRAKEIGMRKVLGGRRSNIIWQFLSESMLVTATGFLFAINLVNFALPWFSELTGTPIQWPDNLLGVGLCILAACLLIGLIAGSYPAFFLTTINTIRTLKGQLSGQSKHGGIRSALVVFQFVTSTALIIATILVYNQLHYIQNKKLGFDKEQVLIINETYALENNIHSFKNQLLQSPDVQSATISSFLPTPSNNNNTTFNKIRAFRQDQTLNLQQWTVDEDFAKTLDLELVEGRFFDPNRPADSMAVVLNETAIRKLAYDEPLGQEIYRIRGNIAAEPKPEDFDAYKIIGIVKDFHWNTLRDNIGALGILWGPSYGKISLRYNAASSADVIALAEKNWREMAPGQPFSYEFMDEAFSSMYQSEQRVGKLAMIFAMLAIFISCLGLFGLASFITEQRTKEIGIRKVLGASVAGIVTLLSKDFLRLLLIAFVIASPLAWYFMDKWLENFAYQIQIQWWVFALAAVTVLVIAFASVGLQSVRAAIADPVDSLRNE
ncbi:MAG: FtsX-like permease family protein, partial [Bacteroidota bacterium]